MSSDARLVLLGACSGCALVALGLVILFLILP